MAREISRTFDLAQGAVIVRIEPAPGIAPEVHTLYVSRHEFCSQCGGARATGGGARRLDVEAEIAARIASAERRHQETVEALKEAGWLG